MSLLIAWGATRLALFAEMLLASPNGFCDPRFYDYAGRLAAGQWPYLNVPVEYPPGAMLLILLPALPLLPFARVAPRPDAAFAPPLTHLPHPDPLRYGAYGISFAVEMLLIDLLTLWLVRRAGRQLVPGDRFGLRSGLLYVGLVFVSAALLQKFDLAAGMLCLAAVLAMVSRREGQAGALLALAALVKGFPLLAAPALVVYALLRPSPAPGNERQPGREGRWRGALAAAWPRLRVGALAFTAVAAAPTLMVALLAGPAALLHTVVYHVGRGTEIESLYGNIQLALGWLPGLRVSTRFNPQDLSRVVSSAMDGVVTVMAPLVMGAFLLLTYAGLARAAFRALGQSGETSPATRRPRRTPGHAAQTAAALSREQILLAGTAASLLAFLLAFRALPAHYLLDVLPLAVVIWMPHRRWQGMWLGALLAIAVCGQALVGIWPALVAGAPAAVLLLSMRNVAWLLTFGILLVALWQVPGWRGRLAGAPGQEMGRRSR